MLVVSRCLERIGDHAVDIGEQTAYLVTGEFREFTDASRPSPTGPSGRRHAAETPDAPGERGSANERTYLAWWRTGLTAIAVGIATGGIAPKLAGERRWAYVAIGFGFAALGAALLAYGLRRQVDVNRALERGRASCRPTRASSRSSRPRPQFSAC